MDTGEEIDSLTELFSHLNRYVCGIAYEALAREVAPLSLFPDLELKITYTIEAKKEIDPASKARELSELILDNSAFILIPGTAFDSLGTRHGRGGGWYDRFLSAVPRTWLRVGICYEDQFSDTPLTRESWDEPMDFICVVSRVSLQVQTYKVSSILTK